MISESLIEPSLKYNEEKNRKKIMQAFREAADHARQNAECKDNIGYNEQNFDGCSDCDDCF